jgi:hypothetical protein
LSARPKLSHVTNVLIRVTMVAKTRSGNRLIRVPDQFASNTSGATPVTLLFLVLVPERADLLPAVSQVL